jgi:uncharacterized protein (TIGR02246 family)
MRATLTAKFLWAAFLPALFLGTQSSVRADQAADEAAIRANAEKYVESYNRRDSRTMASMWSPDAIYTDSSTGESVTGREAIAKQLDYVFAGAEDAKLSVHVDTIDFVSPNVAVEKGTAEVTYAKSPTEKSEYTAVSVRRDGKWLLDRVTDTDIDDKPAEPPPSNYEHLKELEWMIGSWIDADENAVIETDCEWTRNRNFMTRSFAMIVGDQVNTSGMQVVGWDPVNKQIHSWVFDSDGAFSEGTWTHKGNKWFIQQKGTLVDGGQTTALNIIKRLDDNAFTWQSINRTVDGEMLPNIDEAVVNRKPGEEGGPQAANDAGNPLNENAAPAAAKTSTNTNDKK